VTRPSNSFQGVQGFQTLHTPADQRASAPAPYAPEPPDPAIARRAAFLAAHADDQVTRWAVGGPKIASFGRNSRAADLAWSQAFDTIVDEYGTGTHHVSYLLERCLDEAMRNGAGGSDDDAGDATRERFRQYIAGHGTVDDHYGTVDMDNPPQHEHPAMRDIPEGVVLVEASTGGDPSIDECTHWLVPFDEYRTRGDLPFVINPETHQQITYLGGDE